MSTARERLRELLKQNPNPCATYSGQELGRILKVSRERVRQLFGGSYKRNGHLIGRLVVLLKRHPEAVLPVERGGMRLRDIAQRIHTSDEKADNALISLGYLPRRKLRVAAALTESERSHNKYERHKRRLLEEA